MAGGSGTRFWPFSTPNLPKQFLNLTGEGSMIQLTISRLKGLVPLDDVWVLTQDRFVKTVQEQCPELPVSQIVGEPMARDTSGAVALGAGLVNAKDPNSTMVVLPADHVIQDVQAFQDCIHQAVHLAEQEYFVTIGIKPTYPAEIYGYLERGEGIEGGHLLKAFVEKPEKSIAEDYLKGGQHFWNAGMFVWQTSKLLQALKQHLPEHESMAQNLGQAWGQENWPELAKKEFEPLNKISIDYGLMEKLDQIAMVEAAFDWNDVGGWAALEALISQDQNGNTVKGAAVIKDSSNNIIISEDESRPVLINGISDCVIVNAKAGSLVCHRSEIERIKGLIEQVLAL
jgi:mannose-1-phosphate guanylyltransferase